MSLSPAREPIGGSGLLLAAGTLGFSAMLTQLTLLRELLVTFSGNELVLGILLGTWLLLTGFGSWLGRGSVRLKNPRRALFMGLLVLSLLPLGDLLLLRTLRDILFIRGAEVDLIRTVLASVALLLPYCLLSGFLVILACSAEGLGRIYVADSVGGIFGGVLFSVLVLSGCEHALILTLQAFLCLAVAFQLANRASLRIVTVILALSLPALALLSRRSLERSSPHIAFQKNSPYGFLVVEESGGEFSLLENGVPLATTHDLERAEEDVHYALAQRPEARRVLALGGSTSGIAKEILKYGVDEVRCVELDPMIVSIGRQYFPDTLSDPRIHIATLDGRRFLRQTEDRYDAVLVGVPGPSTCQLNRYYTLEFFREVKAAMVEGGVLSLSVGQYENHLGPELAQLIAGVHSTLSRAFKNVLIIPGGRVYFLASEGPLTLNIGNRLAAKGIATRVVRPDWLKEMLKPERRGDMDRAIAVAGPVNRDFSPVLYFLHLRYWMSQFPARLAGLCGVLAVALGLYLFRIHAVPFVLFTAGLAGSALEVVILLGFQVLYGSAYGDLSLIITLFMAGLAVGSWVILRRGSQHDRKALSKVAWTLAIYACLLPALLLAMKSVPPLPGRILLGLLAMTLGLLVGMQLPLAAQAEEQDEAIKAAHLFTADYVGACSGAVLVSAFLIPLLGVQAVCLLTAGLCFVAGMTVRRRVSHA